MNGQIIKVISNDYTVKLENNNSVVCKARGIFRNRNISPFAGDFVKVDVNNNLIVEIYDRKNKLNRPPVCNIDIAIVVVSTVNPDFSINLLDKMITVIEYNNIEPVIVITKADINIPSKVKEYIEYYKKIGYKVFFNTELEKIKETLKNKTVILTGQTGVGKSSLLNKLDSSLNLKTDEISKALGRGKHTTRAVEFYEVNDILIADTPGFSSLNFSGMTREDIRDNFVEFNDYRDKCKYRDCMHIKESDCYILKMVEEDNINKDRYLDYVSFIKEKDNEGISFNIKRKE